jgi:membrane protein implicated in regulation of membrane protease activity
MWFWPGLDRWPPPKEVWIAAAIMALVVTPILALLGIVGQIIFGVILSVCIVLAVRRRLKQMNVRAEEFWRSGPDD